MAAAPEVMAAFQSGSGVSGDSSHDVFVLVLAALMLIWLAWAVAGVGVRYLDRRLTQTQAIVYVVRAVMLALLIVFYLVR